MLTSILPILIFKYNSRSRGFGFVTFAEEGNAQTAISSMNDQELDGRSVRVNLANGMSSFTINRPS
jgi:RNA recognition motif-containing protein